MRVLAINFLALVSLAVGLLYLGDYEEGLRAAEFDGMRTEARIMAAALAEGAAREDGRTGGVHLDPDRASIVLRQLYETTETRIRVFDSKAALVDDTRLVGGPGGAVEVRALPEQEHNGLLREAFDLAYEWAVSWTPLPKQRPAYRERAAQSGEDYSPVRSALQGADSRQTWTSDDNRLVLGVAVPVRRLRQVIGAILVTRDTAAIETAKQNVRENILKIFLVALAVMVLLSLYLAGTITRPILRLARAAERVRKEPGREGKIPDLTRRRDEIGELSGALREMTEAIRARMDAIEQFAEDVSHEIKNPLTSIRSAVETASRIEDPKQQQRLLDIIQEDVQRLDRLITDISDASRLDAELSRTRAGPVDMAGILATLEELYRSTRGEDGPLVSLRLQGTPPFNVLGLETRLVQVFRNLITNALTFSPSNGRIEITLSRHHRMVETTVTDEGPGIPANKLEAIFDRFYTERPAGEKFGTHSGLGLAISKQIIDVHRGEIFAANRPDGSGACFTVRIPETISGRRH